MKCAMGFMELFTSLTPAECRLKAETNLALADRDGLRRESLLADAGAWMLLAERLEWLEAALAVYRGKLH
jgi:hypothetical protein